MEDVKGFHIKHFARKRGIPTLSCYESLLSVIQNDWVPTMKDPKFQDNNVKLWYSVMLYDILKKNGHEMN